MASITIVKATITKHPVGAAAAAVAVVMLGAFFVRHSRVEELQSALAEKEAQAHRQSLNISYYSQLEEQLHDIEESEKLISERLVNPQDLASNLQYFYKLEAENGVKLLDTRPGSAGNSKASVFKSGYKSVQYTVSLKGSFLQVLNFIRRLEQGGEYCRVISATCNVGQDESNERKDNSNITVSLSVEILGKS